MFNEDKFNDDVNNAFKKLSEAQTPEEIKEILENWPEKENYFVKNEEVEDTNDEIENIQE